MNWNPGTLLGLSGHYWRTCALHAAVKLDVFTALGGDSLSAGALAKRVGADAEAAERLLNALAALELVEKNDGAFANTPAASAFLSKDSETYLGHMIMHHHFLAESWVNLDQAVLTGAPVRQRGRFDDARREAFLMGMFTNGMLQAPSLVGALDIGGASSLLDLGGGPGTYAIHFCRENPGLEATVFDLPTTAPFAEKTIAQFEMSARVRFEAGDYVSDALHGEYDVVWMSHILHGEGPEICGELVRKAVGALKPGGLALIHEFILGEEKNAPLFPALFDLNMLLGTEAGRSYSEGELRGMLAAAGLEKIRRHEYCGPTESGVLMGNRPL